MKIVESKVALVSQHHFEARFNQVEKFRSWQEQPDDGEKTSLEWVKNDLLEISKQALAALQGEKIEKPQEVPVELSEKDKHKILMIEKLLKALTGKEIRLQIPEKLAIEPEGLKISFKQSPNQVVLNGSAREGWGLEYYYQESYRETEKLSFGAKGIIKTSDGKEIDFELELNLSRSFTSQKEIMIKAGDALIDPLVINYDGPAATLTDTKFQFDLDADGEEEWISFLQQESGFLTLDRNGDGLVTNGTELFGVQTGDGFSELAAFDQDKNGWIDEGDEVFHRLRIWTKDAEGKDRLFALVEKGIGAIYLGNIDGQFTYTNAANERQGMNQKTGIFVKENGVAGSMQQIDLVV